MRQEQRPNVLFPHSPMNRMAKNASSPAKSTFNVKLHVTTDMNVDVEASNENEAWEIATAMDREKWNRETSEEEYDGVTQITKRCPCGNMMERDDSCEQFECEKCGTSRPMATPWIAKVGLDGFSQVVNSDSIILAQKCVTEEAVLFAASPMLLEQCEIQLERWRSFRRGEWRERTKDADAAIESLQRAINQAYGK